MAAAVQRIHGFAIPNPTEATGVSSTLLQNGFYSHGLTTATRALADWNQVWSYGLRPSKIVMPIWREVSSSDEEMEDGLQLTAAQQSYLECGDAFRRSILVDPNFTVNFTVNREWSQSIPRIA